MTAPTEKKPFYKSLTVQGNAICFVGFAWLLADLLVKPAEMLISHGKINFIELVPSTVMVVVGSISGLWGRFRKGDLLVEVPKPKRPLKAKTDTVAYTGDYSPVVPDKVEPPAQPLVPDKVEPSIQTPIPPEPPVNLDSILDDGTEDID